MQWIYLSPHLDDAIFSCGGLIWEQVQAQEKVEVWTIFAGDPPGGQLSRFAKRIHNRWGADSDPIHIRRLEDVAACSRLDVSYQHFTFLDCIYRTSPETGKPLYASRRSLFETLAPVEQNLVDELHIILKHRLPFDANVVYPLGVGKHVDHRLVRFVVSNINRPLWFYADFPYVRRSRAWKKDLPGKPCHFMISQAGMNAWQEAVACYATQLSSFWEDISAMQSDIHGYINKNGGLWLWHIQPDE